MDKQKKRSSTNSTNSTNRTNKNDMIDIGSKSSRDKIFRRKVRIRRGVVLAASLLFLVAGSLMLYGESLLNSIGKEDGTIPNSTMPTGVATTLDGENPFGNTHSSSNLLSDPDVLNVMLYGKDASGGNYGNGLSDTAILLSIDAKHQKLKLTSFLRDTYVSIPGYGLSKLNHAFSYGGPLLSIKTIESNFGIQIDRYAIVNFESFIKIIDILGGIDIEMTADEADYINFQLYYNHQVDSSLSAYDQRYSLEPTDGIKHLTGKQAIWYARNRGIDAKEDKMWDTYNGCYAGYDGEEWLRAQRQRKFLQILVDDMKTASLPELKAIIEQIGPYITTNFNSNEILSLLPNMLTFMNYSVEELQVPTPGTWNYGHTADRQSITSIFDWEGCCLDLAEFIYEDVSVSTAE
jgi:LCP family protein required for cell wall assembly